MNYFKLYYYTIPKKYQKKFLFLIFIIFINSILEFLSISALIPVVQSLVDKEFFLNKHLTYFFSNYFNYKIENYFFFYLYLIIFVTLFIIKTILHIFFNNYKWYYITNLKYDLSIKFAKNYLQKNFNKVFEKGSAHLIRIIETELDKFSGIISDGFLNLINSILLILSIFTILIILQPKVFLGCLFVFGIAFFFFVYYANRKIRVYGEERFNSTQKKIKLINNFFKSIREIKVFNAIDYFLEIFSKEILIARNSEKKYYSLQQSYRPLIEFISIIFIILFMILSIYVNGSSSRVIIEIAILSAAAVRILPAANNLLSFYSNVRYHLPSIELISAENLEINDSIENNTEKKIKNINFQNTIELKNISFKYHLNDKLVLNNINLKISKGDIVYISGKSGSGKTTLVNIIIGLLKPSSGKILIDNKNKNLNEDLILNAAFVSQDIILLDDTVEQNVAFGIEKKFINKQKVIESLKEAEIYNFITDQKDGLNIKLNEMSSNLSGGQKQRIAIARAYYYNSDIYVLDEPTSSLDFETQTKVINNLINKKKTIILITHNEKIKKLCNNIIELTL